MFSVESCIKDEDRFKYGFSTIGSAPARIKRDNQTICIVNGWLNMSCGMAGLSSLREMSQHSEDWWPAFRECLVNFKTDGAWRPQRFQFITTSVYTEGSLYKGLFKRLVEESTLLLEYKNHSHESRPNLLYMLDLGNA